MDIQTAIARVVSGQSLLRSDMESVIRTVMQGEATEAQIGGLLVGLRMKGETIDEIVGAAAVMRALATPVPIGTDGLIDLAGTGGDGANLFNVSTAATFVVAAAGGRIAKHGNRSVSSSSGSSDVLSALGVNLAVTPDAIADCIDALGVGFMFAPMHHSAMKHAIGPRQQLAVRTIFNILGPLTNPAGARRQVLGVFSASLCKVMAPNGVVMVAGAGVFARIFIHETMGINLGTGEDMTPENIAANWDKVSDMDDARPLQNGGEQTLKIFELINKG